ncbi:MAG: CHRD domain-containing protein [Alphaproteobacteria bacterium]|nr:MAG: CHRD domain-containing protein [Alphaproteobacteria bacterium]
MTRGNGMRVLLLAGTVLLAAGCASRPQNENAELQVSLTGIQEVPGPGDPDGNGTAQVRVNPRSGEVCWNVYARAIGPATAAHIHRGEAGAAGPVVVPLTTPDAAGHSQGCATVDPALAHEIGYRGHSFYLNVHDSEHPNGAIRGQLRGGPRVRERGFTVRPSAG